MRTFLFLTLSLFCCSVAVFGQATLDTVKTEYDVGIAEIEVPLAEWRQKYVAQLQQLKARVQTAGDLDQLLAINQQIEDPSAEVNERYAALKRINGIYHARRGQLEKAGLAERKKAMGLYRQKLMALQTRLTQAGNIDEALEVKSAVTQIEGEMTSMSSGRPAPRANVRIPGGDRFNRQPGSLVIEGSKDHDEQGDMSLPVDADGHAFVRVFAWGNYYYAVTAKGEVFGRPDPHSDHKVPQGMKPVVDIGMARHVSGMLHSDGSITPTPNTHCGPLFPKTKDVVKVSGGHNINGALRRNGELLIYGYALRETPFAKSPLLNEVIDFGVAEKWVIIKNRAGKINAIKADGDLWDNPPEGLENVVQMAPASVGGCLFLTKEGKVISWQVPQPPADLGPVRQIRSGSRMFAAQKADGTWVIWGHEAIAKNMNKALDRMGPLKDLALGYRFFIGIQ